MLEQLEREDKLDREEDARMVTAASKGSNQALKKLSATAGALCTTSGGGGGGGASAAATRPTLCKKVKDAVMGVIVPIGKKRR